MIKSDPKRKIFEKLDIIKTCEAIEIKLNAAIVQFFFSMHADDKEQHFN